MTVSPIELMLTHCGRSLAELKSHYGPVIIASRP